MVISYDHIRIESCRGEGEGHFCKRVRVRTAQVQGASGQLSLRVTVGHHPHTLAMASPWPEVRSGSWQPLVHMLGQLEGHEHKLNNQGTKAMEHYFQITI